MLPLFSVVFRGDCLTNHRLISKKKAETRPRRRHEINWKLQILAGDKRRSCAENSATTQRCSLNQDKRIRNSFSASFLLHHAPPLFLSASPCFIFRKEPQANVSNSQDHGRTLTSNTRPTTLWENAGFNKPKFYVYDCPVHVSLLPFVRPNKFSSLQLKTRSFGTF